jgi:phospholipid transport system transporter-binding protein
MTSQATLQQGAKGRLEIHGDLSFESVPGLWNDCRSRLADNSELEIDLSHVQRSDSAGLALLVEWLRQARQTGKTIRFLNIPAQMLAIARVSCLDQVLPLQRD